MATVTKPIALDESFNTTEVTPRNIADVLAEGLSHITGRTASEVEYDNTDSGLTADNVQDALDEIAESVPTLPTTDIQTAVDEFETYNGGLLSSLKVALTPNQDLHGYDSPWVGGAGKNKAPLRLSTIKSLNTIGTWSNNVYVESGITATFYTLSDTDDSIVKIHAQGTATAPVNILLLTENDVSWLGSLSTVTVNGSPNNAQVNTECLIVNVNGGNSLYIESSKNISVSNVTAFRFRLGVWNGKTVDSDYYPMVRDSSVADDTFEPYSNICPITGHTQVEVGDDGKNLCDPTVIALNGLGGDHYVATTLPVGSVVARIKGGKTYTVSIKNAQTIFTSTCKEYPTVNAPMVDNYAGSGGLSVTSKTITTSVGANYLVVNTGSNNYEEIKIEEGSTATPYVPYNGYQVTVNLGGTYYSGTLDVVSGVLTVDKAKLAINTSTIVSISKSGLTSADIFTLALPSTYKLSANAILSHYPYINTENVNEFGKAWLGTSNTQLRIGFSAYGTTTLEDFKTWLDANNVEGCFELATPLTIQLSPTMVKALVDENHLSAPLDGQEITESKYKQMFTFDDVIAYIQSLS